MACDVHGAQQDQGLEFWQSILHKTLFMANLFQLYFLLVSEIFTGPNKVIPLAMANLVSKYSTARITSSLLMQLSTLLEVEERSL